MTLRGLMTTPMLLSGGPPAHLPSRLSTAGRVWRLMAFLKRPLSSEVTCLRFQEADPL